MAELPYLTEQQIRDKYAQQYADYEKQRNAEADRAKAEAKSAYDSSQRQNYINYMKSNRDFPEQMARLGLTGGASETSALRNQTNYENNRNYAQRDYNTNVNSINNTLADTLNTYKMTADANMNDEIAQNAQLRAQYEKQLQQEAEQRFANTISGYDSISGIDAEIAKIQKSGVDLWKIDYLRARRAELAAAEAAAYSGGGGGGYSYSGGGGGDNEYYYDTPVANTSADTIRGGYSSLVSKRGGLLGGRKSSSPSKSNSSHKKSTKGWNASKPKSNAGRGYRNSKKGSSRKHGLR